MSANNDNGNGFKRGPSNVLLNLICADEGCGATLEHGDEVKIYGNGKIYGTECHGPSAEIRASRMERGLNPDTGKPAAKKTAAAPRKKTRGKGKKKALLEAEEDQQNVLSSMSAEQLAIIVAALKA